MSCIHIHQTCCVWMRAVHPKTDFSRSSHSHDTPQHPGMDPGPAGTPRPGFQPQGDYAGHSFRIGDATSAALAGVEDSTIQALGRRQSAAFLQYIRMPREQLASIFEALGGAAVAPSPSPPKHCVEHRGRVLYLRIRTIFGHDLHI